jgi:two-component system, response regulator
LYNGSLTSITEKYGPKERSMKAPLFISHYLTQILTMENSAFEIVLVEDNPDDAGLIIRALNKHHIGNSLIHLTDGAEALDYIFAKGKYSHRQMHDRPKVILLDLKMPRVGGLEVLQKIKSNELTKSIPVVMMTSSREERDIIESYNLGANSYVVKPVAFDDFLKVVADLGYYWLLTNLPG